MIRKDKAVERKLISVIQVAQIARTHNINSDYFFISV